MKNVPLTALFTNVTVFVVPPTNACVVIVPRLPPGFCTVIIGFNADSVVVAGLNMAPECCCCKLITAGEVVLAGTFANLTPCGKVMVVTPPPVVAVRARDTMDNPDPARGERKVLVCVVGP